MSRTIATQIPILFVAIVFLTPSEAQARRRIPLLITFGEQVSEIADVPEDAEVKEEYSDAVVGYRYDHAGVFWLAIWTWNGEFCVYSKDKNTVIVNIIAHKYL